MKKEKNEKACLNHINENENFEISKKKRKRNKMNKQANVEHRIFAAFTDNFWICGRIL